MLVGKTRNHYLLIDETDGTFSWTQMRSSINCCLISQANIVGLACLYSVIWNRNENGNLLRNIEGLKFPKYFGFLKMSVTLFTTSGVATFGFEPPITPGLISPVSSNLKDARKTLYVTRANLVRILLTHPWDTLSCLDISHGRTPPCFARRIISLLKVLFYSLFPFSSSLNWPCV